MSARTAKLVVVLVLFATLLHPIVESMDVWDSAGPGNDSELTLVGIVIGVGLLCALARLVKLLPQFGMCPLLLCPALLVAGLFGSVFAFLSVPHLESPPGPLRI